MLQPEQHRILLAHRLCLESAPAISQDMAVCAWIDKTLQSLLRIDAESSCAAQVQALAADTRKALYRLAGGLKSLQAELDASLLLRLKSASYCLQNPIEFCFEEDPQGLLRAYLHFLSVFDKGLLLMDAAATDGMINHRRRNRFVKRVETFRLSARKQLQRARQAISTLAREHFELAEEPEFQFRQMPGVAVLRF